MRVGFVIANRRSLPVRWNSSTWLVIAYLATHCIGHAMAEPKAILPGLAFT
jgi:hypothetical protein